MAQNNVTRPVSQGTTTRHNGFTPRPVAEIIAQINADVAAQRATDPRTPVYINEDPYAGSMDLSNIFGR